MPLLILFVLVPIIEISLFIKVGGLIGLWPTIGLVLLSAFVGMTIIRSQGQRTLLELQRSFQTLRNPTQPLAHGAMIIISGMLLLTPGFLTDIIGLMLLIPGIRTKIIHLVSRYTKIAPGGFTFSTVRQSSRPGQGTRHDDIIDGEYSEYSVYNDDGENADKNSQPQLEKSRQTKRPSGWTRRD